VVGEASRVAAAAAGAAAGAAVVVAGVDEAGEFFIYLLSITTGALRRT
jgi:hypothetical protein